MYSKIVRTMNVSTQTTNAVMSLSKMFGINSANRVVKMSLSDMFHGKFFPKKYQKRK